MDVLQVGGVLNVDPNNGSLFIRRIKGDGFYRDADTPFFVNTAGQFSLGAKLYWDPEASSLTVDGTIYADAGVIGGWTISATTLSASNIVLSSTGVITVGTGNDVAVMSAADATYRFWAGNATAASAPFSVTKAGAIMASSGTIGGFNIGADYLRDTANTFGLASTVTGGTDIRLWAGDTFANRATAPFRVNELGAIFASSGTIGGFTISSTTLEAGSGTAYIQLSSTGSILVGDPTGLTSAIDPAQISIGNNTGVLTWRVIDLGSATVQEMWDSSGVSKFSVTANSGNVWTAGSVTAASYAGIAAGMVSGLAASATTDTTNASNITSGTLPNARLVFTKVPTGDVLIDGHVVVGGVKLATVA